jgi:hypothetical protein
VNERIYRPVYSQISYTISSTIRFDLLTDVKQSTAYAAGKVKWRLRYATGCKTTFVKPDWCNRLYITMVAIRMFVLV